MAYNFTTGDTEIWQIDEDNKTITFLKNGGSVGIGTTNVDVNTNLHVSGKTFLQGAVTAGSMTITNTLKVEGELVANVRVDGTVFQESTIGNLRITSGIISDGNINPGANASYDLGSLGNNWRNLFVSDNIVSGGNVGIGTTNPQYKLQVAGEIASSGLRSNRQLLLTSRETTGGLQFSDEWLMWVDEHRSPTGSVARNTLVLQSGTSEFLTLRKQKDGVVGDYNRLGLFNVIPEFPLDVNGTVRIQGGGLMATSDSNTIGSIVTSAGNVGIGTGSPRGVLDIKDGHVYLVGDSVNGNNANVYMNGHVYFVPLNGGNVSYLQARRSDESGSTEMDFRTMNSGTIVEAMRINSVGNVGIGTTNPTQKLTVADSSSPFLRFDRDGGKFDFEIGMPDTTDLIFRGGANGTGSSLTEFMRINGDTGNVGIGTTSPGYKLHVQGDIFSSDEIIAFSDRRLKEDIKTIESALDRVCQLRGVFFTHKDNQKRSMGVIAQEVQQTLPEVVSDRGGYLGVAYGNMVGLLIEAIKELKTEISDIKKKV